MIAKQVLFEGRVQGVGFRYMAKRLAQGFEVQGWVRNLPDGRVEVQVMGEDGEVEGFVKSFDHSSLAHHIHGKEVSLIPPLKGVKEFSIR